jgi:hypothetical protein
MPDDDRKIDIRHFFPRRPVIPSEVEESLADHEENLPSEDFAWGIACDPIRFDINWNNDTIFIARRQNSHKEITT